MKFYIKKLGCPKNDVDGDFIAGQLIENGHEYCRNEEEAEVVIVNSCGFILPAIEESIQEILQYEQQKKDGIISKLYITGCLSQRYADELKNDIKKVDGFFGLGKIDELIEAMEQNKSGERIISREPAQNLRYLSGKKRYVDDKYPYEYLKIADGCDRYCAYCAIPTIRGRYRSRSVDEIVREAEMLASHGKKELILVSQEGTGYGRDLDNNNNIIKLLDRLEKIDDIVWIRLMYLHPEAVTDRLIEFMSHSKKTLGYFDIPLQHISDAVLQRMKRRVTGAEIEKIIEKIRRASPDNVIRTTFITGFPGESEKDFDQLHYFIERIKFDRLGVFKYSPEDGTAAAEFENQVPEAKAEERLDILMTLQQTIAFEKNIALIDSIRQVIIDETDSDGTVLCRTEADCPEIDQMVRLDDSGGLVKKGDIIDVRITGADGYDLFGEMVS
jgi:ribosomal protein S12 methylthiotransferase